MGDVRLLPPAEARARHDGLAALLVDCVQGGASVNFMLPFGLDDGRAAFAGMIAAAERGERLIFAAFDDDRLSGSVQLVVATPPNQPHRAEVAKLLVHRSARRQGVGARLMAAVEAEARRRGRTLIVLDTSTGSDAERLYRRLGYTELGMLPGYHFFPDGAPGDCIFFWKRLAGPTG